MIRRPAATALRTVVAVGFALATALGFATAGPAQAAACSGTSGVTVVVTFPSGSTSVGCAQGDPSTGLDALAGAGFSYVFPTRAPGFVCRINGQPGASTDDCVVASPANASWSYWHAQPGGSWQYSSTGAGGHNPAPGSVEGWRWGSGAAPAIAPPAAKATSTPKPTSTPQPTTTPTATSRPTTTATPRNTTNSTSGGTGRVTGTGTAAGPTSAGATGSTSAGATGESSTSTGDKEGRTSTGTKSASNASATSTRSGAASSTSGATAEDGQTTSATADPSDEDGGTPWALLGGGLLVAAVLGAGVVVARRRG